MDQNEVPRIREGMIEKCKATDPEGKNGATQRHIKKLEAMSDYDYEQHRQTLMTRRQQFAPTAARLVREVVAKTR
jgi:hypothetical protein